MGFFDDLVLPEEPVAERDVLIRLRPQRQDEGQYAPPVDRFSPALVSQLDVVGEGPDTRVVLTGWSVWPFRFWQETHTFPHGADILAHACAAAGLRISDGRDAVDRRAPRRWLELPPRLQH